MPRYYFDMADGTAYHDEIGLDFTDDGAARDAAVRALIEYALDSPPVGVGSQTLTLFDGDGTPRRHWVVSTAKNGVGEQFGSYQTPRGWHTVCDKISADAAPDAIFYRRQNTGWRYSAELARENPDKDWILTRILWLCGAEPGFNQGELPDGTLVDSYQRGIYIHGGGAHVPFGTPTSKGCVRMTTPSVIDLFELVPTGTDVWIDVAG
jgi:hypothetical protein